MSLSAGLPGYKSTDGGLKKAGFQGPVLAGKVADAGVSGGPLPAAGGVMCVQSTASLTNQIVTTSDATIGARASFIYIPVTTGGLNGAAAPPYVGVGTPLVCNDNTATFMVWSSSRTSWMTQVVGTSFTAGNTTFTTS